MALIKKGLRLGFSKTFRAASYFFIVFCGVGLVLAENASGESNKYGFNNREFERSFFQGADLSFPRLDWGLVEPDSSLMPVGRVSTKPILDLKLALSFPSQIFIPVDEFKKELRRKIDIIEAERQDQLRKTPSMQDDYIVDRLGRLIAIERYLELFNDNPAFGAGEPIFGRKFADDFGRTHEMEAGVRYFYEKGEITAKLIEVLHTEEIKNTLRTGSNVPINSITDSSLEVEVRRNLEFFKDKNNKVFVAARLGFRSIGSGGFVEATQNTFHQLLNPIFNTVIYDRENPIKVGAAVRGASLGVGAGFKYKIAKLGIFNLNLGGEAWLEPSTISRESNIRVKPFVEINTGDFLTGFSEIPLLAARIQNEWTFFSKGYDSEVTSILGVISFPVSQDGRLLMRLGGGMSRGAPTYVDQFTGDLIRGEDKDIFNKHGDSYGIIGSFVIRNFSL